MSVHSRDTEDLILRPKSARLTEGEADHAGRAAGAGRVDALSVGDILALQRSAGNAGVTALLEEREDAVSPVHPVHEVINSSGRPLDAPVRADMEARLGHDFSDVRVHDDATAQASARAVQAHAYTVGSHVVFQRDAYAPETEAGRHTLAHELTHVVQQRSGPVDGTSGPGGVKVSDPADRFEQEAEATAHRAMSTPAAAVQREAADDLEEDETVQTLAIQRDSALDHDRALDRDGALDDEDEATVE